MIVCITCNKSLRDGIYNSMFYPNLLTMLSAFIVLFLIIFFFSRLATKRYHTRLNNNPASEELNTVPLASAAMVLGIGLGGFADGVLLHQILQWHEMLTNKIPADTVANKSINMFWDGIFHLFTLSTTVAGVIILWKLLKRKNINQSGYVLSGGMLAGWGIFNLVEGIIDHHILHLHNVRELTPNPHYWNYGFLLMGVILVGIGIFLIEKGKETLKI